MKNANITNVKWGEIYLCDLGSNKGSVQSGKRPVLVLQNNIGNNNGPTTVVATISSVLKKLNQPTHILLDTSCGLREDSVVMLEQIRTVDKEKELLEYIGEVRDEKTIYAIKQGVLTEFGLIKRPQPRRTGLILTLCPKCRAEFMNIPENILRRVDPLQVDKERCDKCQTSFGYDYLIIRLLFYSGIAGYTKGIATEFTDIQISFFVDGINKGCGSAFSSPNELYTELSKRTTGDIKLIAKWKSYKKIAIVPIEPNAPYREKTNVISSFWLVNLSDDDYTPTTGAKVVFSVYNSSGQRIADETQSFVAPKNDKNLAYFGWYVPDGYASSNVTVKAYIDDGPYQYSHISESYTIASYDTCIEPDTDYKAKAPDGFTVPSSPSESTTSGRWWQWVYSGGAYSKKQFAVANTVNDLVLSAPTNPSAYTENGKLYMKSGYGFELSFNDSMYTVSGYTDSSVNECFAPQYYYALFPEYNYTYGRDKCRSIETVSGKKVFVNAADIARQHFTPIYYPDGEYKFKVVLSDCWTPAGMITTYKTVTVQINGNIYDDWYVGRK